MEARGACPSQAPTLPRGRCTVAPPALGGGLDGGIVECATRRPLWLPYVEVAAIGEVTERARGLGASVLLGPREGPAGWRSVVATRAIGVMIVPAGIRSLFQQPPPGVTLDAAAPPVTHVPFQ